MPNSQSCGEHYMKYIKCLAQYTLIRQQLSMFWCITFNFHFSTCIHLPTFSPVKLFFLIVLSLHDDCFHLLFHVFLSFMFFLPVPVPISKFYFPLKSSSSSLIKSFLSYSAMISFSLIFSALSI